MDSWAILMMLIVVVVVQEAVEDPKRRLIRHCCLPADPKDSLYARKEAYHSDIKEQADRSIKSASASTKLAICTQGVSVHDC